MKPQSLFLALALGVLSVGALPAQTSSTAIIADHRAVDGFVDIPPAYLAQVRQMLVYIAGESHSTSYGFGPELLAAQDARCPAASAMMSNIQYAGDANPAYPPFDPQNPRLRVIRGYGGEDFWFASPQAATSLPTILARYNSQGVTAIGFGWCWDMTWAPYAPNMATLRDPVYRVHWSGRSVGSPQGDRCWGLDTADSAETGNSVNLDTYLAATQAYVDYCATNHLAIRPFFTTGPIDDSNDYQAFDQNEKGYARELKHARIRAWVTAHNGVLFDFADILSYNNAGQPATSTWTDDLGATHTFPIFHTGNGVAPYGAYHFGEVGAVRVAKAMWWMLARLAGWDGLPGGTPDTLPPTAPTNLAATATSSTGISLAWTPSTDNIGVTGYRIYRATGTAAIVQVGTSTAAAYSDTGLTASTTYRYTVAGLDDAGNASAQSAVATATTAAAPPAGLTGFFREGQTFLTWQEDIMLSGETYRIYRHTQPITSANLATATRLAELPEGTARFKEMYTRGGVLLTNTDARVQPRIIARHIIQPFGTQLSAGTGLFVHTVHETTPASFYYAVTTVAGGVENLAVSPASTTGAITESAQPLGAIPYIQYTAGSSEFIGYTMWMDHALFKDCYLGAAVPFYITTSRFTQGGATPTMHLDGHSTMPIGAADYSSYGPGDVYHNGTYLPTWYFGMHEAADFNGTFASGANRAGPVANYIQYRIMQTLFWARRHYALDEHSFHIDGNSMGASGAYGFALAFPKVVTSVFCNEGMTDYAASPTYHGDFDGNYGSVALNNPMHLLAFADPTHPEYDWYLRFNGTGVYDFRDVAAFLAANVAEDFPLIGSGHATNDGSIDFPTQGQHFEAYIRNSRHCFSYNVSNGGHGWGQVQGAAMARNTRTNESRPGFSNVPAKDVMGYNDYNYRATIASGNRGYMLNVVWGTADNPVENYQIIETATSWSLPIFLQLARNAPAGWDDSYVVDITPRNLQRLVVHPGDVFRYRIASLAGTVEAQGNIIADANRLLLIPAVPIRVAGAVATVEYVDSSVPGTFVQWRSANFLGDALANDAISGPASDPDGAGVTNFQRYAHGLAARGPVAAPVTLGSVSSGGQRYLTLSFGRRATAPGLSYSIEASSDLATWTPVSGLTYAAGTPGSVTAQDTVPIGAAGAARRFLRLRVSQP